jgi:hypothetical protein
VSTGPTVSPDRMADRPSFSWFHSALFPLHVSSISFHFNYTVKCAVNNYGNRSTDGCSHKRLTHVPVESAGAGINPLS